MEELIANTDMLTLASQGSEYLVVAIFFIVLVGFWKFVNTPADK